jgi:hypothetical protein
MKFMMIVKATQETEAGQIPTNEDPLTAASMRPSAGSAGSTHRREVDPEPAGSCEPGIAAPKNAAGLSIERRASAASFVARLHPPNDEETDRRGCIIQVKSREEAIGWAKRAPFGTEVQAHDTLEVEVRQLMGPEDFAPGGWPTEGVDHALGEKLGKS